MRISGTIDLNTLKAYELSLPNIRRGRLKCDNFCWNLNTVKSLRELCLLAISDNWENCPLYKEFEILADRTLLVDILPCNLPLELTIPIIENDSYWERCFHDRWPDTYPPDIYMVRRSKKSKTLNEFYGNKDTSDMQIENRNEETKCIKSNAANNSKRWNPLKQYMQSNTILDNYARIYDSLQKTWKQCFVEKYLQEELEEMNPEMFNPEYIKQITDLCGSYLISLHLRQLKHSTEKIDHISLHSLLARLPNLIEFSVCFSQANLGDNFSWQAMKVSENDCELLGNGVEKSNIKILRVLRSHISCNKLKLIIRPLMTHQYLQILDFSHCKIHDEGALALAGLLEQNINIKTLILVNNKIGPAGAEVFANYLCQERSALSELNLKLNPIKSEGGKYIVSALAKGANSLRILILSACGLTSENIHIGNALALNTSVQKLDLSNNHLGKNVGLCLLEQLEINKTLLEIDIRMCNMEPDVEHIIQMKVRNNVKQAKPRLESPLDVDNRMNLINGTKKVQ